MFVYNYIYIYVCVFVCMFDIGQNCLWQYMCIWYAVYIYIYDMCVYLRV